jgi:signal recognition particle receptor subunit beta/uncharacterized membrane-anchored protein YhcB (DUF1043 family)
MSDPAAPTEPAADPARTVLDLTERACRAYGRDDLLDRVTALGWTAARRVVHVVVVGEFKQGKSSLVNALLNTKVCAVDDDIATAVPVLVRHGDEASVVAVMADDDGEVRREPVDTAELGPLATGAVARDGMRALEVSLPRRLLADGLVIVDTPGVGGLSSPHAAATMAALAGADAVVFVTDASQELTRAELEVLHRARSLCPRVVCAVTKTDFYPAWRTIVDLDRQHLAREAADVPVVPVSSALRMLATRGNDRGLNEESGFVELVRVLSDLVARTRRQQRDELADGVGAIVTLIESQFAAERAALDDPEAAKALVEELTRLRDRTDRLRSQAARWNVTLNDGIGDLVADVDHDFRLRTRGVVQECDDHVDLCDPADVWDRFEPWLYERVTADVVANYTFLRDRSAALAAQVAELFEDEGGDVAGNLGVHLPSGALSQAAGAAELTLERMTAKQQGLTVMRHFYSSTLMFTMLGSIAGIALGPAAIGIGLVMGRKGLRDEKKRQLQQRRGQAKNAVRRYCDDVSFHVGKDSRDTLRRIQRQLRDHFSARAEELHRSTAEALKAAQQVVQQSQAEQERRRKDLDAELRRLAALRARAEALRSAP